VKIAHPRSVELRQSPLRARDLTFYQRRKRDGGHGGGLDQPCG
jgi:hypothetical protein